MEAYHCPSSIQPLMLVDTSNGLLAGALRLRMKLAIERMVHAFRRGFLPGRSILQNAVSLEADMHMAALSWEALVAFLFGFSAAFPSLEHDYNAACQRGSESRAALLGHSGGLRGPAVLPRRRRRPLARVWPAFGNAARSAAQPYVVRFGLDPVVRGFGRLPRRSGYRAYAGDIALVVEGCPPS